MIPPKILHQEINNGWFRKPKIFQISFYSFHDAKWGLVFLEEKPIYFTKEIDFPQISYKRVQDFNLVHAHKPFFIDCLFSLGPFAIATFCVSYFSWLP